MVSTIHETVDDETHARLRAAADELGMTWTEFLDHVSNELVDPDPDRVEEILNG